jgi:hypothetical protein
MRDERDSYEFCLDAPTEDGLVREASSGAAQPRSDPPLVKVYLYGRWWTMPERAICTVAEAEAR